MVPLCAKQGVDRKIGFEDFLSQMLSDYECAYACGLAAKVFGIEGVSESMPLEDIKKIVEAGLPKNLDDLGFKKKNLCRLISEYTLKGFKEIPPEIAELVKMGTESASQDIV